MTSLKQEQFLWLFLVLLVFFVFSLGYFDANIRPSCLDFAKTALGGVLALLTARTVPPKVH